MIARLLILFLICTGQVVGQAVDQRSWKTRTHQLDYAMYVPESPQLERVIIGLYDHANPAWQHVTWAQELSWFGDTLHALVLAPNDGAGTLPEPKDVPQWLASIHDSLASLPVQFVSLGMGVGRAEGWIAAGMPGLIIAPSDSLPRFDHLQGVWGLINSRSGDSSNHVLRRLEIAGAWIVKSMIVAGEPYYFTHHKEVMMDVQQRLDSLQEVVNDSSSLAAMQSAVLNRVPEVLRQGKPIDVEVFVARHGEFELSILDLSAREVYHRSAFLSKGRHTIKIPTSTLEWGVYKLEVDGPSLLVKQKFMIRG